MNFLEQLNKDMADNHFRISEFGEMVVYTPPSGPAVSIQAIYDEPAVPENVGAEVGTISHQPRLYCRRSDLPEGKPRKGAKVTISENLFHKAQTLQVIDYVSEKLGHVELILQGD